MKYDLLDTEEGSIIMTCPYCSYKGKTHYYRGLHHCMKCNRVLG